MFQRTVFSVAALVVSSVALAETASAQFGGGNPYGPVNPGASRYTQPGDRSPGYGPYDRAPNSIPRTYGPSGDSNVPDYPPAYGSSGATGGHDSHTNCRDGFCGSTGNRRNPNRCCRDCPPGACESGRCAPGCTGTCCSKSGRCTDCPDGDCSRGLCPPNCRERGDCTDGCCPPRSNGPVPLPPTSRFNEGTRYLDYPTAPQNRRSPARPAQYQPSYPSGNASSSAGRTYRTVPYYE